MHFPAAGGPRPAATLEIARGVRRLFAAMGHVTLPEVTLANARRADVMALCPAGGIAIVEVKSCLVDLRADRKWPEYRGFCDRLYIAVAPDFPFEALPEGVGAILADPHGAAVVREPPLHPLAAARRKAVTLRFAHKAASALHLIQDPAHAMPS